MKLSAWVSTSDLLNKKTSGFGELFLKRFIKQNIFSKNDPKDVLTFLKKSGVNGIELLVSSNTTSEEVDAIKKILKNLNLQTFSVHQSVSKLFSIGIGEIEFLFKVASQLSAEVVVLHLSVVGNKIFDKKYVRALKELEKKYRIKIGMENSPLNPLWLLRTYSWREKEFLEILNKTKFNITLDTTHLAQIGKNIIQFYLNNKDKIVNIHLSDYRKNLLNNPFMLTKDTHLPLEEGNLPIKLFLNTLRENKYKGVITMEINGSIEKLKRSAEIISDIFDNIP